MPRLLVLFHGRTGRAATLAEAIAEGAKSVRFAEVDVRRIDDLAPERAMREEAARRENGEQPGRTHRTFDDVASLDDYEGIILAGPAAGGAPPAELKHLIDRAGALYGTGRLADRVGSAFVAAPAEGGEETALWSVLAPMARLGLILVPPLRTGGGAEAEIAAAREHGRRVATVVEWIAHARSHAQGHKH